MLSKFAVATLLVVAVVGAVATEFNCDAESRACLNGGICHDTVLLQTGVNPGSSGNGWTSPTCICPAGWGGQFCQVNIRECKDSPCQNGATCTPSTCGLSGFQQLDCFTCTCMKGWQGAPEYRSGSNPGGVCDWAKPYQDCSTNPCINGGTCSVVGNNYQCQCVREYTGTNCELPTCFNGDPCQNGGTCNNDDTCTCPTPQYGGRRCELQPYCTANPNVCQNGGTCVNQNGGNGFCQCPTNYGGTHCEILPYCTANPNICQNGATCVNSGAGTGFCQCPTSFYGGTHCEVLPYCTANPTICQNGATCVNQVGGTGYCSPFCQNNPTYCQNGATCTSLGATGSCQCTGIWDGPTCTVPMFCTSNPCMNGGSCRNVSSIAGGAGQCLCPRGFIGQFCEQQLDGCGRNNVGCNPAGTSGAGPNTPAGGCKCYDTASCATNPANGKCACNSGYFDCRCNSTYVSQCPGTAGTIPGRNVDMVCQNGGSCYETGSGTLCNCRPGFWGDKCQNYDNPCLNYPCHNGGQCNIIGETHGMPLDDRFWGYYCVCKYPYYGKQCDLIRPAGTVNGTNPVCPDGQCLNGGTCTFSTSYSGNLYWSNPLTGTYMESTSPYSCSCVNTVNATYYGERCENSLQVCTAANAVSAPCENGGFCTNSAGGAQCRCPCGFAGDRCQYGPANADTSLITAFASGVGYRLDFCQNDDICQNGGTCYASLDGQGVACNCKSGYAGAYCQFAGVRSGASAVLPSLLAAAAAIVAAVALKH